MHPWWYISKIYPYLSIKISSIVSILMGSQPKRMMCNFDSIYCNLCNIRNKETSVHILFECEGLSTIRDAAWTRVLSTMPTSMVNDIQSMTSGDKTSLLMSCYGGSFIPEWADIYIQTIMSVNAIYKERADKYKRLTEDENK